MFHFPPEPESRVHRTLRSIQVLNSPKVRGHLLLNLIHNLISQRVRKSCLQEKNAHDAGAVRNPKAELPVDRKLEGNPLLDLILVCSCTIFLDYWRFWSVGYIGAPCSHYTASLESVIYSSEDLVKTLVAAITILDQSRSTRKVTSCQ